MLHAHDAKPKKDDATRKNEKLPVKEVSLTLEVKSAVMNVMNYGGWLFVDNAKPDAPIVAVRAFGFGKDKSKLKELKSLEHLDLRAILIKLQT